MELVIHIDEPWQQEAVAAIARRFEAKTPDVKVIVKVVPNGEIRARLSQGGTDADIVQLTNGDILACSKEGLLLNLRPWLESRQGLRALFHPSIFGWIEQDDRVAVLPLCASMKGIFYNKQWFSRAGLPYPVEGWTWDDFRDIAVRLQDANVLAGEQRFAARISFHWEYIGLLLLTAGTDWLSPDRSKASGYTNSPEAIQAVQWAVDLVRKYQVASARQDYFSSGDLIRNEVGMMLDYYIMLHEIQPHLQQDLGIAELPRFTNGRRVNEPWVSGFGIHPELAWSLLCELTCANNELTRLVTEGFIVALRSVYEEVGHAADPLRNAVLSELARGSTLPVSAGNQSSLYQLLDDQLNPALAQILFHDADVKETLDEAAFKLDSKLLTDRSHPKLNKPRAAYPLH